MLLYNVKMRIRQKLGLGTILSLSLIMVIFAIIRIAGIYMNGGEIDFIWIEFWHQQECSIAVSMFSITAFRSFFLESSPTRQRARAVSAYWKKKRLLRKKALDESWGQYVGGLPSIPSATLTHMSTLIRGSGRTRAHSDLDDSELILSA